MTDEKRVAAAFAALIKAASGDARQALEHELRDTDPDLVARVGLTKYGTVGYSLEARNALGHALLEVRDPAALAERVLAAWSRGPRNKYYYGDFPIFTNAAPAIVGQPAVRARFIADATAVERGEAKGEMANRRGERAIRLLAQSKHPDALAFVAGIVQRMRDSLPPVDPYRFAPDPEIHAYRPALQALAGARDPRWLPTLLLALEGRVAAIGPEQAVLAEALATDDGLAAPIVRALLAAGVAVKPCLEGAIATKAIALADAIEPYLTYPEPDVRRRARLALRRDTVEPDADPEQVAMHADFEVRAWALKTLMERKDLALFVALLRGKWMHMVSAEAFGWSILPFSWWDWKGVLPNKILEKRESDMLAWARGEGKDSLPAQRMIASIPMGAITADEIKARWPAQRVRLGADVLADLRRREVVV